ncbi:ribosomal protein S18-alanine N-acetyltransferase [Nocardioides sp. TF02-7]|uniref:ribosomal protein S18-alanine N-acetyltransferase n=1 Tax=Nocardioides sp. TF02-7 TaxID=2917724 RepID=UPI001F05FBD1|nr:ribosomal protein S18-alanine N-acetyltransferase [Nocardioides sp. TF02-7]UMG91454.1 ribosomal protein S18-alanine N-acetyltransferase [Nocardioides sp. TF02-7]
MTRRRPRVRRADLGDVVAIAELETEAFPADPWSPALVTDGVAGRVPTVTYLVAERAGDFAGHAVVSVVQDVAELQRIATVAAARRTGVASALLAAAHDLAAGAGAERLLLEVREDNAAARAFYERAGFVELARRARYYRDGTHAVVLERSLAAGDGARE